MKTKSKKKVVMRTVKDPALGPRNITKKQAKEAVKKVISKRKPAKKKSNNKRHIKT